MKIKGLNGFKDILPDQVLLWRGIETVARDVFQRFHFAEIRLPILEKTELFARSIGADTDIVEKEMYSFVDKGVTMRPEATASMLRAYIEHNLQGSGPVQRLFTIGPMFRHERPQKGRLRQFHQMDVEVLGSSSARLDAEIMAMGAMLFTELDIPVSLEINSLGCSDCRPQYRILLMDFIEKRLSELCDDCRRRSTTNPLRVLDCKKPGCRDQVKDAPSMVDHLCGPCSSHFSEVREGLEQLEVEYRLNKFMVRGLDYYVRTTFEFVSDQLGAQSAVCAGGRYDGLIELLGGGKVPGIGFAMGIERLVLLKQQREAGTEATTGLDLFCAGLGPEASRFCYTLTHALRRRCLHVDMDLEARSLKSQMKQADRAKAAYVLIVGDEEMESGNGILRDMKTREQVEIVLDTAAVYEAIGGTSGN